MSAGYSAAPLAKKLGIKPGSQVVITAAPTGFPTQLEPWPQDAEIVGEPSHRVDVIVVFAHDVAAVQEALDLAGRVMKAAGGLWIGWPKKASKIPTELDFSVVQRAGLDHGLVDNKVCAISAIYSGLRFVVRKQNRDKWPGEMT